ncbi:cytochrome P450 [Microbispora rosea subsp. aerata]|nr:cytochrome P450 [Microbispora rosea]GGO13433.1 cytochrome P450 [Microbispora rosea subsp. aerata]GIH54021.1 cytochrome P450 [Microbispora rosea subsp. aerata]GLJ84994.1 cytochrome P450 [Microbispora rosea subsp. aerata]
MLTVVVWVAVAIVVISMPRWLPGRVVALRGWVFTRINGEESIAVPGDLVGVDRFREVYSHPAASGRSKGAALSDLFWYWLSPGPEMHQEHLEAGERYEAVALTTRRFLALPRTRIEELARRCVTRALEGKAGVVRLRDLMMPAWAEFSYELVFDEPCPPRARDLIAGNADDVVTALKCCGLRHMDRRDRLTAYLLESLPRVRHELPAGLTPREQALYLQGAFFNTAVVQMSEATAHVLMALAQHRDVQDRARAGDDRYLDQVISETLRLYPLFGIAHRITTGDIPLGEGVTIPAGSVLCFDYPAFHRAGFPDPDRFDPGRFGPGHAPVRELNHIPFGMAANRPCPAWRFAPLALRAAVREVLNAYDLDTAASHTRSLPNRGPCLLTPLGPEGPAGTRHGPRRRLTLLAMRFKDGWEDVWRSLVQLVLGTYMVWDARRLRLCERHFSDDAPLARR